MFPQFRRIKFHSGLSPLCVSPFFRRMAALRVLLFSNFRNCSWGTLLRAKNSATRHFALLRGINTTSVIRDIPAIARIALDIASKYFKYTSRNCVDIRPKYSPIYSRNRVSRNSVNLLELPPSFLRANVRRVSPCCS